MICLTRKYAFPIQKLDLFSQLIKTFKIISIGTASFSNWDLDLTDYITVEAA